MWFPCKSGQWSLLMRAGTGLLRRCSVPFLHQPVVNVFKIIKLPCLVHWTPEHGHDFTVPSSKPFTSNIRENGNQQERSWHNVSIKICLSFPGGLVPFWLQLGPWSFPVAHVAVSSSPPRSSSPIELFSKYPVTWESWYFRVFPHQRRA